MSDGTDEPRRSYEYVVRASPVVGVNSKGEKVAVGRRERRVYRRALKRAKRRVERRARVGSGDD